ncbi:MAG: PqqD family protein [Clostridia bacterium]|nr:PqqD family protein [Clostridia bacterium]
MQINKEVIHREVAGEHILVPIGETALRCRGVFAITEVGADIWEMLSDGKDVPEITRVLLEMYDVEADVLAKDVVEFLDMLRENGLLGD